MVWSVNMVRDHSAVALALKKLLDQSQSGQLTWGRGMAAGTLSTRVGSHQIILPSVAEASPQLVVGCISSGATFRYDVPAEALADLRAIFATCDSSRARVLDEIIAALDMLKT